MNAESREGTRRAARILVVDDEPSVAELLVDILRLEGHEVDAAADGAEALLLVGTYRYDAVLTDVGMPVLDGLELYRQLRALHPELAARTVFMAARSDAAERLRVAGLPVLAKPFQIEELRGLLNHLLGREP